MPKSNDISLIHRVTPGSETPHQQIILHDKLGDLSAPDAFVIPRHKGGRFRYTEASPLSIHLSVTGRCQARCEGCINTAFSDAAGIERNSMGKALFKDTDPVRDARCIAALVRESADETATICLYGGEPLLAPDKIAILMETIEEQNLARNVRYMLYTNGDLLAETCRSHPKIVQAIWLFSVSIDGTRAQHECIRKGTDLARIHEGLAAIKKMRQGRVLIWSTLREEQYLLDWFNEFFYLYKEGLADQFFWHWVESKSPFTALAPYGTRYEKDLRLIMEVYVEELRKGALLPITHINELVLYLLAGTVRKSTACGVELARNYDIVGGRIHSCADLPEKFAIGTISADGTPDVKAGDLSWLIDYKKDLGCKKCGVHSYCGGRCPVQAVTGSVERLRQYCQLMRLHVSVVHDYLDDIAAALETHTISAQYVYDYSAAYVLYTDGTP
jgi:radical SAM protein with 4Fe4S-binding SPASM domain